jgi:hypothetical protein
MQCRDSDSLDLELHFPIQVLSKIFRPDAVKIIKFAIRPLGRHHHRSSSLPHVDTGPTVSSIFGTLPRSPFLSVSSNLCYKAWISSMLSNRRPFSFNLIYGNRKKSQGAKSGEYGEWGMTAILCETGNCHGEVARAVVAKVRCDVFAHFHAVAAKRRSRTRNSQFGLCGTGASLYHNCCVDSGTSPEYFGFCLVFVFMLGKIRVV